MTNQTDQTTKLDAKRIMSEYNKRFAWVLNFREALPTILRIGEEMGVEVYNQGQWDVGLAHLRLRTNDGVVGNITKSQPGSKDDHRLYFEVSTAMARPPFFKEVVSSPDQLEDVCRRFFAELNVQRSNGPLVGVAAMKLDKYGASPEKILAEAMKLGPKEPVYNAKGVCNDPICPCHDGNGSRS